MQTSVELARIESYQAALSVLSLLNFNAWKFPQDTTPCDGASYDYVVVGGGVEGSVVAARLVEAGHCVLIVEAGGIGGLEVLYPGLTLLVKNSPADWNYTAENDGFTTNCHQSTGLLIPRALGGLGAVELMIYNHGSPFYYSKMAQVTNDNSWRWNNMKKYFKRSENLKDETILNSQYKKYHGVHGKINITRDPNDVCDEFIEGFRRAGEPTPLDNVGNGRPGYTRALFCIDQGRNDAAYSYLSPLRHNLKLQISYHSLVTQILFDEDKNAIGVKFVKHGKEITVKAKNEVIVCAGTIKSPQLLMLSGIGPKKELEKWNLPCIADLPVGQNLQNSVGVFLPFKTNKNINLPIVQNFYQFPSAVVMGYSALNKTSDHPDYETINFLIDYDIFFLALCAFTFGFKNETCDNFYNQANNSYIMATVLTNLNVQSRGSLSLKSTDPEDSPRIRMGHYTNDRDLDAVAKQIQDFLKTVSTPYLKETLGVELMNGTEKCNHLKAGSREYWRCYALCLTVDTNRYVGTNSMGAVVDSKLCVKGVNKLRIVDASVVPNSFSGPPFGTVVALAEKGAAMIISDAN